MSVLYLLIQWIPLAGCAQVPFLEPISNSEQELGQFLDKADGEPYVKKMGQFLEVDKKDLNATYSINRGMVTSIHLSQYFDDKNLALKSFNACLNFLENKGCGLRTVRNESNYRVAKGEGGGLFGSVSMVKVGNRFRIDTGLNSHHY